MTKFDDGLRLIYAVQVAKKRTDSRFTILRSLVYLITVPLVIAVWIAVTLYIRSFVPFTGIYWNTPGIVFGLVSLSFSFPVIYIMGKLGDWQDKEVTEDTAEILAIWKREDEKEIVNE